MTQPVDFDEKPPMVAAVSMGYGHLRAAMALADDWKTDLVEADRPPVTNAIERLVWGAARRGYYSLSRLAQNGARHRVFAAMLDRLTAITHGPGASSGRPPQPIRFLDTLIGCGLGRGLGRRADAESRPVISTFYATALVAERHSAVPVACVVTDSHIHRVWAPRHPASSRIHFLVPEKGTVECLIGYGVRRDRVRVTGFPLPSSLVGPPGSAILKHNLDRRLNRLRDRQTDVGVHHDGAIRITLAVGGAGAQADHVRDVVHELRPDLAGGRVRLTLVAGTHRWVARRFHRWVDQAIASGVPEHAIDVLFHDDFASYYHLFNARLADTDLLWTKPSELVFYGALGLPLVLEDPVGDHERHNRDLVVSAGVGVDRPPSGEIASWIRHKLADGWFPLAATRGPERLPVDGTRNIASYCSTELYDGFTAR
jgi:hypothetical protein